MSNKKRNAKGRDTREYRMSVRAVRRETPDMNKLARAIIDLAMAQAEAKAEAEAQNKKASNSRNESVDQAGEVGEADDS